MNVLLVQLDGALPNVALMRIAAHHLNRGDQVTLRRGGEPGLWDTEWTRVYASAIFLKTRPAVDRLAQQHPGAILGGTGVSLAGTLEDAGITTRRQAYSIYPGFRPSIGFTQRGCRLKCPFCVVPGKEGKAREEQTIAEIWRGDPWPRQLILLDNDFFGVPTWRERHRELVDGDFAVSFCQGINVRFLNDETAEAIAAVKYRCNNFRRPRIYTAWDNLQDEARVFAGLDRLVRYGVKPHHIMVYMLIGYWPGETHELRERRRAKLREFGADPYPMPYVRTRELIAYQRWILGGYDKHTTWRDWNQAGGRPENLRPPAAAAATLELFA